VIDVLSLVACYARMGSPKFDRAAVRWLSHFAEDGDASLRDVQIAASAALRTKQHDLAEKMVLRFLR
jgi:hypothetical protein